MTEHTHKPDSNQDLSTKVKNWVEEQGYSLEMRVAKKFQGGGFQVSQFEHFIDQESGSVRPVDVVASLSKDFENSRVVVKLYVECKYSAKDKPWVIVVTSDKFDKYSFFSRILKGQHPSRWSNIETLQGRITARIVQAMDSSSSLDIFSIKNPGYVVAETLTNQKDHAYEGVIQTSKSVEAHDIESEETYKQTLQSLDEFDKDPDYIRGPTKTGLFFSIAIPLVVISGQLFESSLGDNNEVQVAEIQSGMVFVPYRRRETNPHSQVVLSPVTVVTEKHLDNYVALIKNGIESMLSHTEAINEVLEFEKSKYVNTTPDESDF
ncbi:MAG: hypothetical protein CNIPEHKO_00142 [Anaerolineales bacterium]|nr:hypothetical protein [Anaerolineales bacterium]